METVQKRQRLTWNQREMLKNLLNLAYLEFEGEAALILFEAFKVIQKSSETY